MDLNADLGASFGIWQLGDDETLLDLITSASIACGFHGGDPLTMHRLCTAAAVRGVVVGAQVGYRDLIGFGRRRIEYEFAELRDDVVYQLGALDAFCRLAGVRVRYVKAQGALYQAVATDETQAAALIAAVTGYDRDLPVLCPPGSVLAQLATGAGVRVVAEGCADRSYLPNGLPVPSSAPGARPATPDVVAAQAVRMATDRSVVAIDGTVVPCPVDSVCLHGENPESIASARRVREALDAADVPVAPFTLAAFAG